MWWLAATAYNRRLEEAVSLLVCSSHMTSVWPTPNITLPVSFEVVTRLPHKPTSPCSRPNLRAEGLRAEGLFNYADQRAVPDCPFPVEGSAAERNLCRWIKQPGQ